MPHMRLNEVNFLKLMCRKRGKSICSKHRNFGSPAYAPSVQISCLYIIVAGSNTYHLLTLDRSLVLKVGEV
jgi:hypothetical protein